jgi:FlgD Ig-like domain/SdrD B-like domain
VFRPRHLRLPALAAMTLAVLVGAPQAAAVASTISGTAYKDLNRDAVREIDEPVLGDQQIYLFDGTGLCVASVQTDAAGGYVFSGLADGAYRVAYASPSWWTIRNDWVPSTTGSLRPSVDVQLTGEATADFGWRPIVRSTDANAPMSSYQAPNGLRVSSYDDVVSAGALYNALSAARIGAEAPYTEVRFDLYSGSMTSASAAQSNGGPYADYSATSYVNYVSWLDEGDRTLTHEYGHAWSLYYAYIVQQDPSLGSYLQARGLAGDSRIGSSYAWQPREMIAEDYRQLFGSANARSGGQINTEIPLAKDVPGLADFLANSFTTAPAAPAPTPPPTDTAPSTTPTPAPTPAPPQITGLAMSPNPVKTTGTVAFSLSAPASVTVRILTTQGSLVRTLLAGAARAAGSTSLTWDRKDSAGHRVSKGTYRLQADAVDSTGQQTSASTTFAVSS